METHYVEVLLEARGNVKLGEWACESAEQVGRMIAEQIAQHPKDIYQFRVRPAPRTANVRAPSADDQNVPQ
jgi:hypothetical protein